MGAALLKPTLVAARAGVAAGRGQPLAAFALGFLLVFYLAMKGGGHDAVVRGEVGVALWWVVLLGALAGVLPRARPTRAGWAALGLLAAYCAWTALGLTWTESSERTAGELARVAMHLGVLALALSVVRAKTARHLVAGVATAVTVVAWVALLSRLQPDWFPADPTGEFLPGVGSRLTYPLNYWNGLAALIALALPAVLAAATTARRLPIQAAAAAALPGMALAAYLTLSRGGAIAAVFAITTFLCLTPNRLRALATLLPAAAGTVILVLAVNHRDALEAARLSAAARSEGEEVLVMTIAVCGGVALIQLLGALATRSLAREHPRLSTRWRAAIVAGAACAAIVAVPLAGAPQFATDRWHEFKDPQLQTAPGRGATAQRFTATSGNGRYQYWASSLDAGASAPITGTGPGTWEYWWARNGTLGGFVRHAHSLYFQTLAELGWPGLVMLLAFLATIVACGVNRSCRGPRAVRSWTAAATAGCVAFCVSAAVDWVWELTVVPVAFLMLAAVVLAPRSDGEPVPPRRRDRLALGSMAVLAIAAAILPLLSATALRDSRANATAGRIDNALADAGSAARAEPYAATPALQRAVLLEARGHSQAAVAAARAATHREPSNWRTWITLSRLEARNGSAGPSIDAYRRAKTLNPRSGLFAR
jgi:hypothetical protein